MAKRYSQHVASPATPQNVSAKEGQIKNRAGGFVFKIDDWSRLNRFIMIGNEGGTYYATESELTIENYDCVKRCLAKDWKKTIDTIVQISDEGRAPKNTSAIFALAVCSVFGNNEAKAYANKVMPKVARYSTDFFKWVTDVLALKSNKKGKGLHRAIGRWYTEKKAKDLAYQICKYPSRSLGDSKKIGHAELLRLARPQYAKKGEKVARNGSSLTIPSKDHGLLFQYAVHGVISEQDLAAKALEESKQKRKLESPGIHESILASWKDSALSYVWAHEEAKKADKKNLIKLIKQYKLTRESVPQEMRNDQDVQKALLADMPVTAMIRNLGQMTASGLLKPLSDEVSFITEKLTNPDILSKARIHPMNIFMALKTYQSGHGMRTSWGPVQALCTALDDAFYASFKYVEPTGKKFLVGCDASGSMFGGWGSSNSILPAEAATVIGMTICRTEKNSHLMAFGSKLIDWKVTPNDSLAAAMRKLQNIAWQSTDCALPMLQAMEEKWDVDVFCVLTDNETWAGRMHPFQALQQYRSKFNKDAKLAVLGFTATECSIADPSDMGMMDFVGLDSNIPKLLSEFALGNL